VRQCCVYFSFPEQALALFGFLEKPQIGGMRRIQLLPKQSHHQHRKKSSVTNLQLLSMVTLRSLEIWRPLRSAVVAARSCGDELRIQVGDFVLKQLDAASAYEIR
jgi:hypothetical protein